MIHVKVDNVPDGSAWWPQNPTVTPTFTIQTPPGIAVGNNGRCGLVRGYCDPNSTYYQNNYVQNGTELIQNSNEFPGLILAGEPIKNTGTQANAKIRTGDKCPTPCENCEQFSQELLSTSSLNQPIVTLTAGAKECDGTSYGGQFYDYLNQFTTGSIGIFYLSLIHI